MALLRKLEPQAPPERKLVLFMVGSVVYGFPIEKVREVVAAQPVVELPHAPSAIVGVTDHRGEVVPVIDLRVRFGLPPRVESDSRRKSKWVMVDVAHTDEPSAIVATVVDTVLNVFLTREPLRPAPSLGGGEDERGILGVLPRPPRLEGPSASGREPSLSRDGNAPWARHGLIFLLDLERLRSLRQGVEGAL